MILVFEPGPAEVERWLAPVRRADPVEVGRRPFGPLNMPLYDTANTPPVAAALRAAGFKLTPFTSVLLLNVQHFNKLALEYRLTSAGVADPALLPPRGSPGCLVEATSLHKVLAAGPTSGSGFGGDGDGGSGGGGGGSCGGGRGGGGAWAGGGGGSGGAGTTAARALFLQRLYCVVARYETFAGNTSGLQGALPHHVFDALERVCGVNQECFASPLNCHFPVFYSAFPDTDRWFGCVSAGVALCLPVSECLGVHA